MPKANQPGSQKPDDNKPKNLTSSSSTGINKGKQSGKNRKPTIGGTARPGARSTQPKEIKSSDPQQQQAESYNREMRRRMQHMGAGPYAESPAETMREKRLKRLEKKKQQRLEGVQKTISKSPRPNTSLGRRNTYFLIAMVAILVLLVVIFLIIRHPF
jgi:hypothetical protein